MATAAMAGCARIGYRSPAMGLMRRVMAAPPGWRANVAQAALAVSVAGSSLIFLVTNVAWVRSYFARDHLIWRREAGDSWIVSGSKGKFLFGHSLDCRIDDHPRVNGPGLFHFSGPPWRWDARSALDPCRPSISWGGPYDPG